MADELTLRILGADYPFPSFDTLTYKEARLIKKNTDIVVGEFYDALEKGDPDALFALALIARQRDGRPLNPDELDGLQLSDIQIIVPESDPGEEPDPASPLDGRPPGTVGGENEKPTPNGES